LAADYHSLTALGFQQFTLLFDPPYGGKLRLFFTANCATAALPGNIKMLYNILQAYFSKYEKYVK